jgi:hypothetical protein
MQLPPLCLLTDVCQVDIQESTVTRRLPTAMRESATFPVLIKYLKVRSNWDEATYTSICWPAFSSARFTSVGPRFVPQFCHRHLPVGVKANRNDSKYSRYCPACDEPYETDEHFLLCKAPTRIAWRIKFLAALEREELLRLHTADSLIQFLKTAIDRILSGRIVSSIGTFSTIATSQNLIGWMAFLHGYWSQE